MFVVCYIPLYKRMTNGVQTVVVAVGIFFKLEHMESFLDRPIHTFFFFLVTLVMLVLVLSLIDAILVLNRKQAQDISKALIEMRSISKVSEEYQDML
mmetsp:Transcript_29239/g.44058  ORF Transcript_29239/g.44058 Transcript_29239/m.44058 type:complete len:97 (-) Transcript_29239:2149-2439(-)